MLTRRHLLFSSAGAALTATPPEHPRPNVVLFVSDDQGFGDLSLHGNPILKTPHIDRIAGEGAELTQFYVNPVCSPTRSSLLTGRYYYRTGVVDTYLGRSMMYNDEVTIAEVLGAVGYRTGIFGKWHLGDHYPMRPGEQGFQEVLVHEGGGIAQPSDPPDGNSYFDPKLLHNGRPVQAKGYCTDVFFEAACQFITANKARPFFAYVTPNAPHQPLQVDEKYVAPFRARGVDETTAKTYGMIANLDENVGRLMTHLEREGIAENTILIFMTDNGPIPARYNAGLRGVKGTVYEGGIHVPFLVRWPKTIAAQSKVEAVGAHIDVFPTLLEACGIQRSGEPRIDGVSLWPLLRDAKAAFPTRTLYFQWHRGDRGELYNNCAARDRRYKLVNGKELYDLESDPGEAHDISNANAERVAKMRAGYEAWFRDVESTRHFETPRIYLGTHFEDPVLLTRQDWRGPQASWDAKGLGYWEVDVRASGSYRITLLFPEAAGPAKASVSLGGAHSELAVVKGATRVMADLKNVAKGPSRVEAKLTFANEAAIGPHYVEVRRA